MLPLDSAGNPQPIGARQPAISHQFSFLPFQSSERLCAPFNPRVRVPASRRRPSFLSPTVPRASSLCTLAAPWTVHCTSLLSKPYRTLPDAPPPSPALRTIAAFAHGACAGRRHNLDLHRLPLASSPSALPPSSAESGSPAPPRRLKVYHSVATDEFSSGPRRPTVLQVLAACPSPRSTVMPTPRPFTDLSLGWVRSRLQAPGCSPLLERTTANGTSHVAHCTAVICIAIDDLRPTSLRSQASGPNRISHLATRNSPLTCRFPVSPSCAYTHTHTHTVKLLPDAVTPPSTSTTLLGSRLIAPRSSFFCVPVAAPALDALTGIVHRRARDPAPATRGRECGREL